MAVHRWKVSANLCVPQSATLQFSQILQKNHLLSSCHKEKKDDIIHGQYFLNKFFSNDNFAPLFFISLNIVQKHISF